MFENLSDKLLGSLKAIRGQSRISESNIEDTLKQVRLSLLEADVNFKVVKAFIDRVKAKALGQEVLGSVSAGQQFVKVVHDELVQVLGGASEPLQIKGEPAVIFLIGLQGVGKTTTAAKLALFVRQKLQRKPGLVPADIYRPAAMDQLQTVARTNGLPCFDSRPGMSVDQIFQQAKVWAKDQMIEVVIVDTAGRLQIDEPLMNELKHLKVAWAPKEILLVADAMLGQQSVHVAEAFHQNLGLTGLVLTKVDGDARGGAALSIRETVGVPIKFIGMGEKISALEVFHPDRLAGRILDMGDVLTLVERAQDVIDEKTAMDSARKMRRNEFTMNDFLSQMQMLKKLGGMESLLKMIPGMGQITKKMKDMAPPDQELKRIEAIIHSMTFEERQNYKVLNGSRRERIALGSGTEVKDINRFINQFEQSQKMMSQMMKMGLGRMGGKGGKSPFGF